MIAFVQDVWLLLDSLVSFVRSFWLDRVRSTTGRTLCKVSSRFLRLPTYPSALASVESADAWLISSSALAPVMTTNQSHWHDWKGRFCECFLRLAYVYVSDRRKKHAQIAALPWFPLDTFFPRVKMRTTFIEGSAFRLPSQIHRLAIAFLRNAFRKIPFYLVLSSIQKQKAKCFNCERQERKGRKKLVELFTDCQRHSFQWNNQPKFISS
jgi:hypothetical protein